uniref:Integrase, catalytic region, zinc finger, CCHC-type, peptidase aspartic, catalytic n=1 Tax=Tanacetum cinerariifolium TaxID=118510 RepID=A0A6L2MI63_TANCI|nr:hypothetical protein [Tanacetum cinerariifolium]
MNYLEEQTDGEEMINSIKNGDQPLPRVTQVSIVGTSSTEQPPLKDKSMWSDQEKKIQKIDLLVTEQTKVSKRKEKVVVSSESEGSDDELKKITALLAKAFNKKKFYSKPTNNNLRTSSATYSANKKQEYVKFDDKKEEKKVDEKKRDMSKVKCYNCKKEGHIAKDCKKAKVKDHEYYKTKMLLAKKDKDEQVFLAEDHAWMESSSDSDQEINANMVYMAQIEKVLLDSEASLSSSDDKIAETIHMIMPSMDKMYNGRKEIGFENPSYFCKAKDLRPTLYDERVIGLGYTSRFLIHSVEALEIEKFKRARENKIEFAYDYGSLNATYVNENIIFLDDYFQKIINLDFEKIDYLFQQISSLKPYVPTMILERIIIVLEDEVRYSCKDLMLCNNSHLRDTRHAHACNNARNAYCNSYDVDVNDLFVFDDIVQICLWIIDLGCSKHMTGNHSLLTNFVKKFLETIRFGNNDFAVIAGYGDVVIGSITIKKVYYLEGLGHKGVDLLTGDCSSNLYTIALNEVASNSSACLLAKASSSQSWLWHQRLSHLNFATINNLVKNNLVQDEASKVIISFIKKIQVNLQLQVQRVRTDNGTEFKNKTLAKFFDEVGITQQFFSARTPQQNGTVERRNQTLVEAARTMLTFANLPLFLWAEAITTACFTQNCLIIHKRFDKIPYELINKRKPNIKFFHVFRCRCYLLKDYDDVGKLKEKGDIEVKIFKSIGFTSVRNFKENLEDLFQNFYDEYFGSSKLKKSLTTNVEASNNEGEFFHEVSESFQGESSSSSLNDDVQQSPEEVILPKTNTQSISNDMIPNVEEASTSHNVFNEHLEDAYFDATLRDVDWVSAGSLMYVTSSRPDIMFATYMCARY